MRERERVTTKFTAKKKEETENLYFKIQFQMAEDPKLT